MFGVAVALSVGATLTHGSRGRAAGCLLLSLAAALVVGRADVIEQQAALADGGRYED